MKAALTTLAMFRLDRACEPIRQAYGQCPYLVGSILVNADERGEARDVDVRLILPDDQFATLFPTIEIWQITCLGIGSWLQMNTGLQVDFQIQRQTLANEKHKGPRNPLGLGDGIRHYAGGGDGAAWGEPKARTLEGTRQMSQRTVCPTCGGKGQSLCHIDGSRDGKRFGETRMMPCSTCNGAGEITLEHHERIVEGERRRNDRMSRCVTLREEAKRLGISPVELSDIESGRTVGRDA